MVGKQFGSCHIKIPLCINSDKKNIPNPKIHFIKGKAYFECVENYILKNTIPEKLIAIFNQPKPALWNQFLKRNGES